MQIVHSLVGRFIRRCQIGDEPPGTVTQKFAALGVAVRRLPAGYTIGYGRTFRLVRDMLVGTIAAGYADGLPLNLSNRGYVVIKDRLCPILGRLSMDYTTVSLESFREGEVTKGDEVICLGGSGPNAVTVENWAQIKGTHPYDVICSIGNRVERIYME